MEEHYMYEEEGSGRHVDLRALREIILTYLSDLEDLLRRFEVSHALLLDELKETAAMESFIRVPHEKYPYNPSHTRFPRITVASHHAVFACYTYSRLAEQIKQLLGGTRSDGIGPHGVDPPALSLPPGLADTMVNATRLAAQLCLKAVETRVPVKQKRFDQFFDMLRMDQEELVKIFCATKAKSVHQVIFTPRKPIDKAAHKMPLLQEVTAMEASETPSRTKQSSYQSLSYSSVRPKLMPEHVVLRDFISQREENKKKDIDEIEILTPETSTTIPRFINFMDVAVKHIEKIEPFLVYPPCRLAVGSPSHPPPSRIIRYLLDIFYDVVSAAILCEMSQVHHQLSLLSLFCPNKGGVRKGYSGHGVTKHTLRELWEVYTHTDSIIINIMTSCSKEYEQRITKLFEKITSCSCDRVFHIYTAAQ